MARSPTAYISLQPTTDSRLSLADARELIAALYELEAEHFELLMRNQNRQGLELFIGVPRDSISTVIKNIHVVAPDIIASKTKQVLIGKPTTDFNLSFKKHYSYPLYYPETADPEALIRLMRSLSDQTVKEAIEVRFILKTANPVKARILRRRLLAGSSPNVGLAGSLSFAGESMSSVLNLLAGLTYKQPYSSKSLKVANPKSVMLLDKLYEPLFSTRLVVSIKSTSSLRASKLAKDIESAFSSFAGRSGYQQFKAKPKAAKADIYSASDLAALFHFNNEDLSSGLYSVSRLKILPPLLNKLGPKLPADITLGVNKYQGTKTDIVLCRDERYRHVYISGATGSGKSTLIANMALQDIDSGQGITLIDPHGDLAEEVLSRIPSNRLNDVIYFDPSDALSDIRLNLLQIKSKPGSGSFNREADQVTESIISLFRKIFSEDKVGHRVEYILRNTIQTALTIEGSTIFTIYSLLNNPSYRLKAVADLSNPDLINFWRHEIGRAGSFQQVKMAAGVTAKIGRFLFSEPTKRVFGQSTSTLNLSQIMDDQKILICNFSKGSLGEDGSRLFCTAMLTKLQLTALSRVNVNPDERVDNYLYVDEFQTYAPSVLIQILSEARKYGLYLTMAEQSPSQQDTLSTSAILANVGSLVCFRTASPKDEQLLLPSFKEYLSASNLNNLPAYNFYLKTTAIEASPPTSGQTYPIKPQSKLAKGTNTESSYSDVYSKRRLEGLI